MEDDVGDALLGGELDRRLDVLPAGVDAAVGDQTEQVQAPARAVARPLAGAEQSLVLEEAAVGDRVVDPGQVLLDDRAGAEVEVADLGVAHLALWQADVTALGGELRVGIALPEAIEDRRLGERDRVAGPRLGKPPAVEDDQCERREATSVFGGPYARPGAKAHRTSCCLDDRGEVGRVEGRAADQGAVDVGLTEQLGGVVGLDRAAVEDAHLVGGRRRARAARRG